MSASMENLRQDVRRRPAELEREADLAREAVEGTLHELERQLSPSELVHRVIDAVKQNAGGFSGSLLAEVRSNPVPALLAGVGVAWLMLSPKRAAQSYGSETVSSGDGQISSENEGADSGHGLGNRWSSALSSMHETAADGVTQLSKGGVQRVTQGYSYLSREQPLVLGALAVVVGAAIGAMLPSTGAEDGWLGDVSDEAKARLKSEVHGKAVDLRAAAMAAAATVQQGVSAAAKGDGSEPLVADGEARQDDPTNADRGASESVDTAPK